MNQLYIILEIIQYLLLAYLLGSASMLLVFSIAGLFNYEFISDQSDETRKFILIIPAYKEDNVILKVVRDALTQNYPKDYFDILVLADSFEQQTIEDLHKTGIKILEIKNENSSKALALKKGLEFLPEKSYDVALILDADNLMEKDFLMKMNQAFNSSFSVFQAHRKAINMNTPISILDAINEEVNNHLFRKGQRVLNLSTLLIGSGIAFKFDLLKSFVTDIESIFEDKDLDFLLLKNNIDIEYLEEVILWDEKIQDLRSFGTQRRRWIASQIHFFNKYMKLAFKLLFFKRDLKRFIKAIEIYLPPRLMLLSTTFIFSLLTLFINPPFIDLLWISSFFVSFFAIILAVPKEFYTLQTMKAILLIPLVFFIMLKSLLTFRKSASKWDHTKHTGINDIIENNL